MARKVVLSVIASVVSLGALGLAPAAGAAPISLRLNEGAAFAVLGHWCGGIQEKVYGTGFGSNLYPTGEAFLSTTCNGSGRGGHSTTYTGSASVVWDWYGETRSYAKLEKPAEGSTTFSATDAYGDHEYNSGTSLFLETTTPPVLAPGAPTNVTAIGVRIGEEGAPPEVFQVTWTPAPETAGLIHSSQVTATPVGSTAPVLTGTVTGGGSYIRLGPVEPNTTYKITVTDTDLEGTSQPGETEATSKGPEEEVGEKEREEKEEEATAGPPEFGRCVQAPSEKSGKTTYYYGAYTSSTCLITSTTHTGKYEWEPGVFQNGFKTAIKAATVATFETTSKVKVTCTGESSSGLITGLKKVGSVQITFTGCESAGKKCTTGGLAEGELNTSYLEGKLGVEKTTVVNGKEVKHIALDLYPAGGSGPFLQYTCAGGEPTTLSGAILEPVTSGKMLTTTTWKYAATGGRQKPEAFEGEEPEVLTSSLSEQVGLTLSSILTSEEAIEINTAV